MIVFKHVDKVYPNGFKGLSDVNLTINDGDFLCIIGLSGAGKSTLLRTINRMHTIQGGELTVDVFESIRKDAPSLQKEIRRKELFLEKYLASDENTAEEKKEAERNFSKEIENLKEMLASLPSPEEREKKEKERQERFDKECEAKGEKPHKAPKEKPETVKVKLRYDVSKVKGKELRLLRRNIGMIFQSFNLVKRSSAYKNALSGRVGYHNFFESLFGIYTKDEKMLALQSLEKLGILDKAFSRCDELSGGQMQRVALARALTQEPNIILADEPVASLDPVTTLSVMDDFKRINRDYGITIVANMHHVDLALKYANRIIGIKAGKIVFDGKPSEVTDEVITKVYGRALLSHEKLGEVNK